MADYRVFIRVVVSIPYSHDAKAAEVSMEHCCDRIKPAVESLE